LIQYALKPNIQVERLKSANTLFKPLGKRKIAQLYRVSTIGLCRALGYDE
jgi:hypothetical protein